MTSHAYKRCAHCRTIYCFQSSGWGCDRDYNDGKYCPECAETIATALSRVPVRFEQVWIKTEDVDVDVLVASEKALDRVAIADGKLRFTRVAAPLFDMRDPSNLNNCFFIHYGGKEYLVETWSKKPEKNTVKVAMEKNLKTGELKSWRNL